VTGLIGGFPIDEGCPVDFEGDGLGRLLMRWVPNWEISTAIYSSGMPVDRLLGVIVCGWAGCHPGPRAAGELVGLRWRHADSRC